METSDLSMVVVHDVMSKRQARSSVLVPVSFRDYELRRLHGADNLFGTTGSEVKASMYILTRILSHFEHNRACRGAREDLCFEKVT